MAANPAKFLREVRTELGRVAWPGRKETTVTTALVLGMVAISAVFFFGVDQLIGLAVRALFGAAG
ncbi:MAG: preprotein translocase subunit SecE [Rhodospirillales bacterium]|nr:preprotein translocase subunit SecE [Rhodospirillales bacterium]